jgi:membrane protease YdiL (CAAX protease family)
VILANPQASAARAVALIEVLAAFAFVHITYRAIKQFTVIGTWEGAAGGNFTPGIVMMVFTALVLLIFRRDFKAYGLTLERWKENLSLGLCCTVSTLAFGGLGLVLSGFAFDALHPPNPHEPTPWSQLAVVLTFVALGSVVALAIVAYSGRLFRGLPAVISVALIAGVLIAVPLAANYLDRPSVWALVLSNFVGAGFGEEIFFRGYLQSRVDQTFGRPYQCLGFEFGMGLLVSSLLFGLIHALNTVDYFHGKFDFGWRMGLQSIAVGLFYGLIKARTGSVLPGAIEHGLSDVLVCIPQVLKS